MEDRNTFEFTTTFGVKAQLDIQDYTIEVDQSILPISDIETENGVYAPDPWRYSVMPVSSNTHALITLDKGMTSAKYER